MGNQRIECGRRRRARGVVRVLSRRRLPTEMSFLVLGAAVAADALVRCLHRTSRLGRQTRELALLARTDSLTGLHNRRHLEEHLSMAVSAARRHGHPLSVLFVDIDGFKDINDALGYEAGDDVLRVVGARMRLAVRAEDLVGRWGGEEFVVVLPGTDLAGAVVAGERIRASIADAPIPVVDRDAAVTVSVGCASAPRDPAALILASGRALRQAKREGKNRVVAAGAS